MPEPHPLMVAPFVILLLAIALMALSSEPCAAANMPAIARPAKPVGR